MTFGQGRNQTKFGFSPASFTENLTKFETESKVQNVSGFPHVISVVESERIACSFKIKESDFVAGDIVLWDEKKKVVADPNGFSLPASGYTPIGVVVIPASHMDDGHARMMSTRWMSCDDPENGSVVAERMVWGTATEISGLTYYNQVPVIARYDGETGGTTALTVPQEIYTANTYAFLPSDCLWWVGETNPEDEGTRWYQSERHEYVNNFYAPSPYASDGTPNPLYRATSYSGGSISNALSYFDGRSQTNVILEARGEKDYGTWKPTFDYLEDFPPASCCNMYHTVGTSQGDWYLPSLAELGYIIPRNNEIISSMAKVGGMFRLANNSLLSSTVTTATNSSYAYITNGIVNQNLKNTTAHSVAAFALV